MKREKAIHFGFSLIEVIVAIAMVGLIASISFAVVTQIQTAAEEEKLSSDAETLNRAIGAYLASGGSLDGAKTPADVLTRLKSGATDELRKRMPGFSSSLIDPRISLVMQDASEASSGDPRVQWIAAKNRFLVARSGVAGVKEFILDDTLAETPGGTETRDSSVLYSKESTWVWDYQNRSNPSANDGPTVIAVVADVSTPPTPAGIPGSGPPVVPPVLPLTGNLSPPVFSLPGANYPITSYPLSLTLSDPNPPGASKLIYAVDFGSWQDYSGTISASPGSTISAQSVALAAGWSDSGRVDQAYNADPATLAPPSINPDYNSFGLFFEYDITVNLSDPNKAGDSITRYRVNGGAWQDYSNPFLLKKADYPSGATVEAQAVSSGSPWFLDSTVTQQILGTDSLNLAGNTSGAFNNPTGPSGMETNLSGGNAGSYFEWGDGQGAGRSESWMDYAGSAFGNVSEGESFAVGSMTYYNGTIKSGSGAETVDLDITLSLDINGNIFNPYFDFAFELVNTPNGSDEWASADYVRLIDPRSSRTLIINDYEFEFRVEFGETTADGFAAFDEFHVIEEKDASVNIYGTLVSIGPVGSNGDPLKGGTVISTDPGVGTAADPLFQKEGYVDPVEHVNDLIDYAKNAKDDAKDARGVAEDGFDDAAKGAADIAAKIADEKYADAAILAADTAAGALAADAAAFAAEVAVAAIQNALDKALELAVAASGLPGDADELKKQYYEIEALLTEAEGYATEAKAYADAAAADAAVVAAIWEDFQNTGPVSDPEGYVAYLAEAASDFSDTAKNAESDADNASADAVKRAGEVVDEINDGKYADAVTKADEAAAKAAEAEAAAQIAEAAADSASDAAIEANTIASTNPGTQNDADDASSDAADTADYAADARAHADIANQAAADAAAAVAAAPVAPVFGTGGP